jgi:hypothetical protein
MQWTPLQNPKDILYTNFFKSTWKYKRSVINKTILSKKSSAGGITILDLRPKVKATWYWNKSRHMDI